MAFNTAALADSDGMHWNNNNSIVTEAATKGGFPSSPCFQVYGTKRKLTGCSTENVRSENKMVSQTKRQCWGVFGTPTQVLSEANPEERLACGLPAATATATAATVVPEDPQGHGVNGDGRVLDGAATPLGKRCQQLAENLQYMQDMEMESNDYWSPPREYAFKMQQELEEARMLMESDYAPNQAQYQPNQTTQGHQPSPNCSYEKSLQVKCYCKPNWDGLLSSQAFM